MTEALRLAAAAAIAIVATGAAPPPDEPSPALKPLLECRATADPAARLACFDRAVDGLTAATRSGDVVVTDRATVREAKRARFGLGWLPHREAAGAAARSEDDDTPTEITSTVAGAVDHGYGTWDYALANGMRWRQVEPSDILPKAGQAVTIRKAAFGSYFLKIGKERAVRVVRLR